MIRFIHLSDVHLGAVPTGAVRGVMRGKKKSGKHSAGSLWVSARIRWICCL